jgi:hypothetical protein
MRPLPRRIDAIQFYLWLCALPYVALTVIRWIATGRGRFGPRW